MMGKGHAWTGVLAAVGTAQYIHADIPTLVLLCTTFPGAALLPDIDHAKATVSNTFGPFTRVFSYVLGHRRETHSIPGILSIGMLVGVCASLNDPMYDPVFMYTSRAVLAVVLILLWASVIRLFKIRGWLDDLAPIPVAVGVTFFPEQLMSIGIPAFPFKILAPVVIAGMLVHVVGDLLTKQGCPLMWPFSNTRTAVGLFKAGGRFERWIMVPVIMVAIAWSSWVWIMGYA